VNFVVALLISNLPARWWGPFEERFAVSRMAMTSAVAVTVTGLILVQAVYRGLGGPGTALLSLYMVASGVMRIASALADDIRGDPLLTGLDEAIRGRRSRLAALRDKRARELREGPEVADRLVRGDVVGRGDVAFVLLASRIKPDWGHGSCLVGQDGAAYRIGHPFDIETPAGLRRAYPLTAATTLEVIRHGIPYDLPPVSGKRRD
jgi:hypothetical protein